VRGERRRKKEGSVGIELRYKPALTMENSRIPSR